MQNGFRSLSIALFAIGLVTCADITGGTRPGGLTRATFALAPKFDANASRAAATAAAAGLAYDQVRIVIVRPGTTDTLKDTTVAFHSTDAPLTLELSVLAVADEPLGATIQFKSGSTVLFQGSADVTAVAANIAGTPANAVSIAVTYIGPGSTAATLVLSPGTGTYAAGIVTHFLAKAFDAANVEVLNAPIVWSVNDTSVATIDPVSGDLTAKVTRGTVTVTASLGSLSQSATVTFAPPATGVRVVQGAAQTGAPGSQLPLPIIVEAVGADGLPAFGTGLTATFVANTAGSASPATVPVSANGRAQTSFTLGSNAGGIFLYTATIGSFSVIIPEIAVVGPPTQLIPSGSTTLTFTAGVVPNPIPTFRVADAVGNSVPFVPLKATITKQGGTSADFPFLADTIGLGNIAALAPTVAGTFTVTIASGNPAVSFPALTYTITILPGAAAKLFFDKVPTTAQANTALSPGVSVLVQDSFGNTVTSSAASVTIGLDPTTGAGETLTGGGPVTAVSGVAGFTNVKITPAKSGVKLTATSSGLTSALSSAINITP